MNLNDNATHEWPNLLKKNRYLFIKYRGQNDCKECEKINSLLEIISRETKYNQIKFVRMQPENNPVAERHIKKNKAFVAAFKDGLLVECAVVSSEQEIRKILDNLQKHQFK